MSAIWMVALVVSVSISSVLAYWLGYHRGWLVGTAEALEDMYGYDGDANE